MVGLEVEPFLCIRPVESHLQIQFGLVEKQTGSYRRHSLPAKKDDVVSAVDVNLDGCVCVGPVPPVNGSVGLSQLEGELGRTVEVQAVDRHLARIRNGSGERRKGEQPKR